MIPIAVPYFQNLLSRTEHSFIVKRFLRERRRKTAKINQYLNISTIVNCIYVIYTNLNFKENIFYDLLLQLDIYYQCNKVSPVLNDIEIIGKNRSRPCRYR